jgi:hypothetical protein
VSRRPTDELPIEDILAVEHDVILDGADVFQQGETDHIGDRIALTAATRNYSLLPRVKRPLNP